MPLKEGETYPLTNLKGVGPKTSSALSNMGIESIIDSVFHLPSRYEDRTTITSIGNARINQSVILNKTSRL